MPLKQAVLGCADNMPFCKKKMRWCQFSILFQVYRTNAFPRKKNISSEAIRLRYKCRRNASISRTDSVKFNNETT